MKYELKIKKIEKKTIDTDEITDETKYILKAEHAVGLPKITIQQEEAFVGFKPKDYITIEIKSEQTTIEEHDIKKDIKKKRAKK